MDIDYRNSYVHTNSVASTSWYRGRLAAFDIETTGTDPESARIVAAAVSLVGGARASEHLSWLVDPGVEIPASATYVHGVTTARARAEGRIAEEAIEEITATLAGQLQQGVPIVAFNARFDLTILDREARRHGPRPLLDRVGGADGMIVVDPHVLDKQFDPRRYGKRTLSAVCEHYRVTLDEAHTATADALAAARVACRLGATVAELGETDIQVLHRQQINWAIEQAESLEKYLRRQGRHKRVEGVWPVIADSLSRAA
jgi:DNA polymerase III subunit epsilon